MSARASWLATCLLVGAASCGGETETLELSFPSVEAFVASDSARVFVVPTDATAGVCERLLSAANRGTIADAEIDTGRIPVCDFRAGGVELPTIDEGLRAYVALATDAGGAVLLSGCALRDVHADSSEVRIVLTTTETYRMRILAAGYTPVGCSVQARCSGTCP